MDCSVSRENMVQDGSNNISSLDTRHHQQPTVMERATRLFPQSSTPNRCPSTPNRCPSTPNRSPSTSPKASTAFCKYVYDLPYSVRKSLCDLLDADGSWRQLGGEYFGLDEIRLTLVSHAFIRGGSPTNDLLVKWEQTNPKILQLFKYFSSMKHFRAMNILKPFVDPEIFKSLFIESEMNSKPLFVNLSSENIPTSCLQDNCERSSFNGSSQQGAIGGSSLPPYNSGFYCHNYVNLGSNDDEFKVFNNDLGKGDEVKVDTQSWNNFSEKVSQGREVKSSTDDPRLAQGQEQPLNQQTGQTAGGNTNQNKQSISSSMTSSTRTSVLSQVEEDLEIMYKELMIATDDFSEDNIIGSGGFGVVYKGEWKGTQVAIKRMKNNSNSVSHKASNQSNNNHVSQAITELRILNRYRIDNILPLYGISLDGPEACIVYQYMSNGSLEDRLLCKNMSSGRRSASNPNDSRVLTSNDSRVLTWQQRASIGEGIARALNYLHTLKGKPLVHGDVKSANVLLDAQFEPKLGDFGLSRQVTSDGSNSSAGGMYTHVTVTSVHGTSVYLPPEYLRQKILSPAVDTYSYGVVMLEMATGKRAYDGKKLLIDLIEDEMKSGTTDSSREGGIKLRDSKLPEGSQGQSWFHSLIKLGIDCAHKVKRKRPDMSQVLDFYNTCKTRDRIRRLSLESGAKDGSKSPTFESDATAAGNALFRARTGSVDGPPSLPLPPDNADIRTPLELQLWYDMVKKETKQDQQSTICPTIGSEDRTNQSQDFSDSSIYSETRSDFVDVCSIPVPSTPKLEISKEKVLKLGTTVEAKEETEDSSKEKVLKLETTIEAKEETEDSVIPLITELGIN